MLCVCVLVREGDIERDIKREREGEGEKEKHIEGAERRSAACVNVCSNSAMTVCALFCLCVYNESSVIGQVDVVSNGGRGNTLQ